MNAVRIPKHLDDPGRFLFWPVDEAAISITVIVLGLVVDSLFAGIIVAIITSTFHTKVKKRFGKTILMQATYWYLPGFVSSMKCTPPSHIRSYLG